jgi:3-dehydroquinate dehydratase/shikimate dehydrogenase
MICVVIGRTRHKMMLIEVQEAAKRGAEMIELRLDYLRRPPDFKRLLAEKPCPLVATVRRGPDGGRWTAVEDARRMLLRQAIVAGFDWVDLETDLADEIRRFKNVKRIVSYHNLQEVPADLEATYERMCGQDPDVIKIAVTAQRPADNLRVLKLLQGAPRPTVAFCMGDFGVPSRILAGKFGAPFTYAAFNKERTLAPGIVSFDEMQRVYHYDEINRVTEVYGVIGDPVGHSLSPLIHNAVFRKLGVNAVYLPFRVPRGELEPFLNSFDKVPVRGYSVTIPHKEAAAEAADHQNSVAARVQSANTLVRGSDGFTAYNTDGEAALESIKANLLTTQADQEPTVAGRMVLLLGAGGVARSIAFALHDAGAYVSITNRTAEKAQALAEAVGCRHIPWEARNSAIFDTLVNCTSVGMHPELDEMPVHPSVLKPELAVFDVVYNPENTLLIKEARDRGCRVLTGVDMFVRQAALQVRLFTNREPPLEEMRKLVRRALSPVTIREET